jgi:hypothetical protein
MKVTYEEKEYNSKYKNNEMVKLIRGFEEYIVHGVSFTEEIDCTVKFLYHITNGNDRRVVTEYEIKKK